MSLPSKHPRATMVAALALLLFAGFRLVRHLTRPPHSEAIASYYSDMSLQAQKVTENLSDGAKLLVLVFDGELKMVSEGNFRRVYRDLEKRGLSILHEERLVFDEEKGWNLFAEGFPYGEYLRVARAYPEADAVLSLCGEPYFSGAVEKPDPSSLPDLLLARVEGDVRQLVREGWVKAAVVRRVAGDSYEVVTREGRKGSVRAGEHFLQSPSQRP